MSAKTQHALIVADAEDHSGLDNLNLLLHRGAKVVIATSMGSSSFDGGMNAGGGAKSMGFHPTALVIVEMDPEEHAPEIASQMDADKPTLIKQQADRADEITKAKAKVKAKEAATKPSKTARGAAGYVSTDGNAHE